MATPWRSLCLYSLATSHIIGNPTLATLIIATLHTTTSIMTPPCLHFGSPRQQHKVNMSSSLAEPCFVVLDVLVRGRQLCARSSLRDGSHRGDTMLALHRGCKVGTRRWR
uniref:Uncharacterized protein n=1 Tax=Oryza nivara TaxID=4536 RepID=A0A0E0HY87_ORYNI